MLATSSPSLVVLRNNFFRPFQNFVTVSYHPEEIEIWVEVIQEVYSKHISSIRPTLETAYSLSKSILDAISAVGSHITAEQKSNVVRFCFRILEDLPWSKNKTTFLHSVCFLESLLQSFSAMKQAETLAYSAVKCLLPSKEDKGGKYVVHRDLKNLSLLFDSLHIVLASNVFVTEVIFLTQQMFILLDDVEKQNFRELNENELLNSTSLKQNQVELVVQFMKTVNITTLSCFESSDHQRYVLKVSRELLERFELERMPTQARNNFKDQIQSYISDLMCSVQLYLAFPEFWDFLRVVFNCDERLFDSCMENLFQAIATVNFSEILKSDSIRQFFSSRFLSYQRHGDLIPFVFAYLDSLKLCTENDGGFLLSQVLENGSIEWPSIIAPSQQCLYFKAFLNYEPSRPRGKKLWSKSFVFFLRSICIENGSTFYALKSCTEECLVQFACRISGELDFDSMTLQIFNCILELRIEISGMFPENRFCSLDVCSSSCITVKNALDKKTVRFDAVESSIAELRFWMLNLYHFPSICPDSAKIAKRWIKKYANVLSLICCCSRMNTDEDALFEEDEFSQISKHLSLITEFLDGKTLKKFVSSLILNHTSSCHDVHNVLLNNLENRVLYKSILDVCFSELHSRNFNTRLNLLSLLCEYDLSQDELLTMARFGLSSISNDSEIFVDCLVFVDKVCKLRREPYGLLLSRSDVVSFLQKLYRQLCLVAVDDIEIVGRLAVSTIRSLLSRSDVTLADVFDIFANKKRTLCTSYVLYSTFAACVQHVHMNSKYSSLLEKSISEDRSLLDAPSCLSPVSLVCLFLLSIQDSNKLTLERLCQLSIDGTLSCLDNPSDSVLFHDAIVAISNISPAQTSQFSFVFLVKVLSMYQSSSREAEWRLQLGKSLSCFLVTCPFILFRDLVQVIRGFSWNLPIVSLQHLLLRRFKEFSTEKQELYVQECIRSQFLGTKMWFCPLDSINDTLSICALLFEKANLIGLQYDETMWILEVVVMITSKSMDAPSASSLCSLLFRMLYSQQKLIARCFPTFLGLLKQSIILNSCNGQALQIVHQILQSISARNANFGFELYVSSFIIDTIDILLNDASDFASKRILKSIFFLLLEFASQKSALQSLKLTFKSIRSQWKRDVFKDVLEEYEKDFKYKGEA